MRVSVFLVALAALCIWGTSAFAEDPPVATASAERAASPIAGLPASLTVKQRSTTEIPGAGGKLSLSVDDITRAQVMVTLMGEDDKPLAGPFSMRELDTKKFKFGGAEFRLTIDELNNALVGEDYVSFTVATPGSKLLSESQKIQRQLEVIESLDGATFIRNGEEYPPRGAAMHLRQKLRASRGQVKTAKQFIDRIASKSSTSGDEYIIRHPTSGEMPASDFLREELKLLEAKPDSKAF